MNRIVGINISSQLNEWIDFIIVVNETDLEQAEKIATAAYDEWFDNESDEPIAEYIRMKLDDACITSETYFK